MIKKKMFVKKEFSMLVRLLNITSFLIYTIQAQLNLMQTHYCKVIILSSTVRYMPSVPRQLYFVVADAITWEFFVSSLNYKWI